MSFVPETRVVGPRSRRGGSSTVVVLLVAVLILACCGLAVDTALVNYQQQQLELASESAARAAANELADVPRPRIVTAANVRVDNSATARARRQAVRLAANNFVGGERILKKEKKTADDFVQFGWLEDPGDPRSPFRTRPKLGRYNAVRVRFRRTRELGNPLTMWCARKFGLTGADREVSAIAVLDQRVYGFRPVLDVSIPVLPIGAPVAGKKPAHKWEHDGVSDHYDVDRRTRRVRSGADGRGEFTLFLACDEDSAGKCKLLQFGTGWSWNRFRRQIRSGLSAEDLKREGGQLQIGSSVRVHGGVSTAAALKRELDRIRGKRRVWPVIEWNSAGRARVVSFRAGCLVATRLESDGLVLRVQRCSVVTSTALVGPKARRHAWIGKVVLAH